MIAHYLLLLLGLTITQAIPLSDYDYNIEEPITPDKDIIDLSAFGSDLFGTPDLELTAALVDNFNADTDEVNPEELGSYLEGDLLVPETDNLMKNALITQSSIWPQGIVPYEIQGNFTEEELNTIQDAIEQYHQHTCIRFVPHTVESDYISIKSDKSGCWSSVGRRGGKQVVNLQTPGCLRRSGTTIHELMHALGFLHEQNRKERDDFVSVKFQNIWINAWSNFRKVPITEAFGVPYDFGSVMHYSGRAFSNNGRPTMVAKQAIHGYKMGQRLGFSNQDIEKLNRMYDCITIEETVTTTATKEAETVTNFEIQKPMGTILPPSSTQNSTSIKTDAAKWFSYLISRWPKVE